MLSYTNTAVPVISSKNDSDSIAIIGGAVGGVILLLMITVVLCIVIVCVRRCHRKGTFVVNEKTSYHNTTTLNTDVTTENHPLYDMIKSATMDSSTVKLDLDVLSFTTPNPSENILTKPCIKTSEDARSNEFIQHLETIKMQTNPSYWANTNKTVIKMSSNPSYGINTGNLDKTVKMDSNPSYGINTGEGTTASYTSVTNSDDHDYDYVNDDHFLHEDTATTS